MQKKDKNLISIDFLAHDIEKLENYLSAYTESLEGILRETVRNTLMAGGKRIRPSLFLICARNENYDIEKLLPAAASIEILHTASLIHDDIIDKSILRRGKRTIHQTYDKDTAKFVGDYLFTQTFAILNAYNDARINIEMSAAAELLVRGEFDQLRTKKDIYQSEKIYFGKIFEKTSSLFKVSCTLGGILSKSADAEIENMGRFGEYIGTSFQINDDLIDVDINGSSVQVGKPVGNDLRQGDITLPFIYSFENLKFRKEISKLLKKGNLTDKDMQYIPDLLIDTGAIEKTRAKFFEYINMAIEITKKIEGSERQEGLLKVCESIINSSRLAK